MRPDNNSNDDRPSYDDRPSHDDRHIRIKDIEKNMFSPCLRLNYDGSKINIDTH